nr:hypothetical protein [Mesorhizobium sp.]
MDASAGKNAHDQYSGLAGGLDESLPRKTGRLLALQHRDEGFAGLLVARPASPSARCGEDTRPPLGWKASAQFHTDIALPTLRIQIAAKSFPQFANGLERILQMVRPSPACRIRGENADHSRKGNKGLAGTF